MRDRDLREIFSMLTLRISFLGISFLLSIDILCNTFTTLLKRPIFYKYLIDSGNHKNAGTKGTDGRIVSSTKTFHPQFFITKRATSEINTGAKKKH